MPQPDQNRLRVALVVLALLLSQTAALSHVALDDIHSGDEPCEFCVALASYAGGNIASTPTVDVPVLGQPRFVFVHNFQPGQRLAHRLARGPPSAS